MWLIFWNLFFHRNYLSIDDLLTVWKFQRTITFALKPCIPRQKIFLQKGCPWFSDTLPPGYAPMTFVNLHESFKKYSDWFYYKTTRSAAVFVLLPVRTQVETTPQDPIGSISKPTTSECRIRPATDNRYPIISIDFRQPDPIGFRSKDPISSDNRNSSDQTVIIIFEIYCQRFRDYPGLF
jgi:hypothetical protein